jgi:hypothetical protein
VGDLVDRGPESLQCLELLREPWFHCVLGNHEQMMLHAFFGGRTGVHWLQNGGNWGLEALCAWDAGRTTEKHALHDLLPLVADLPIVITVTTPANKKFHVMHAELPQFGSITDADLADPAKILDFTSVQTSDGDFLLWGRELYLSHYKSDLSNYEKVARKVAYAYRDGRPFNDQLSHIISGHTMVQRPLTIVGQTNIDTCAFGSYRDVAPNWCALTCVELGSWEFFQARATEFRKVEAVAVNRADIEETRNGKTDSGS